MIYAKSGFAYFFDIIQYYCVIKTKFIVLFKRIKPFALCVFRIAPHHYLCFCSCVPYQGRTVKAKCLFNAVLPCPLGMGTSNDCAGCRGVAPLSLFPCLVF